MSLGVGILSNTASFEDRFIPDYDELRQKINHLQGLGNEVVLTMGVYDLVHIGHAKYLEKARQQGDVLVVGVDSDKLTKDRKGDDRPVVPERERLKMLSHIRSVDILTLRELSHGMNELVEVVKPDVLVVSETTEDIDKEVISKLEGFCGEVKELPPQAETSTTNRIRKLTIDGALEFIGRIEELIDEYRSKRSSHKDQSGQ